MKLEFKIGNQVSVDRYGNSIEKGEVVALVPFLFGEEIDAYKIRIKDTNITCRAQSIVESKNYNPVPIEEKSGVIKVRIKKVHPSWNYIYEGAFEVGDVVFYEHGTVTSVFGMEFRATDLCASFGCSLSDIFEKI